MAVKGEPFEFSVSLFSQSTGQVLLSPTIQAADFEISTDGGAYAALTNTPTVTPASSGLVAFDLTASEVGDEKFSIKMVDSVGSEWETMFYHETVELSEWDRAYADHTTAGTFGKLMDQLRKANQAIDGSIDGASTTTSLDTDVTGYTDEAFDGELVLFVSGTLEGESRPVLTYNGTTGVMAFEEPWTSAPSVADEFVILPAHIHPISEIANGIWSELQSSYTTPGTFGYYLDARVSNQSSGSGANTVTITVTDGTDPLENAVVSMAEGLNVFAVSTNASGEAVFNLDDATFTVAIYKSGYSFAGANLVVDGTTTQSYSMSPIVIPTTPDPDTIVAYINLFDENGAVEGKSCSAELTSPPATGFAGYGFVPLLQTGTSTAKGLFSFTAYAGATYKLVLNGVETHYLIPSDATDPYQLPSTVAGC